jgi:6-phosphogluconolactonase
MRPLIVDDPAGAAVDRLAAVVAAGGQIALAGGSTPRNAYERLAEIDAHWTDVVVWFGDERCVPPDDERSNYRMVREALLDPLGDRVPEVHRVRGEEGPDAAAAAYESELREAFGEGIPRLDLILLGIGADGHTASLFPNQPSLDETGRLAVSVPEAAQPPYVPRVTLTLAVINAAREVLFLIEGAGKSGPVAQAFGAEPSREVPASLVRPMDGELTILLDPAAAAELPAD